MPAQHLVQRDIDHLAALGRIFPAGGIAGTRYAASEMPTLGR